MQDLGSDRMPFGVVAVQEAARRPVLDGRGQFPAEVERVLYAEVEALAAQRRVDVRGVARRTGRGPRGSAPVAGWRR